MDTQFKQRLTGAVILVLLAALLVPELLTGPKSPAPGPTSSSTIPSQPEGAPLRSYDIDLSEPRDVSAPEPEPGPASPAALPPATPAAAGPAPGRATITAVPANDVPGTSIDAPAAAPAPIPAEASGGVSGSADATPAPAMRGFAVQVGSFASRASADRLAADLRSRRFETFVASVRSGGRLLYRVRVGPVADRAAAQSLSGRLKAVGQSGSIVPLP